MRDRWGVFWVTEWQSRRLGVVAGSDAVLALEVARRKFFVALREVPPGGTLVAVRTGMPAPIARSAARGEFFSPKVRLPSRGGDRA